MGTLFLFSGCASKVAEKKCPPVKKQKVVKEKIVIKPKQSHSFYH
jgi:hypothetical protein